MRALVIYIMIGAGFALAAQEARGTVTEFEFNVVFVADAALWPVFVGAIIGREVFKENNF